MSLIGAFGLGAREMVAFVGGGGKTTTMLALARELAAEDRCVVLTTTTLIGGNQTAEFPICRSVDDPRLEVPGVVWLLTGRVGEKLRGTEPATVDLLFRTGQADYMLVEADGASGKPLKAPGPGEPVVPWRATVTVAMMGVDAVGMTVSEASHRIERVRTLTGLEAGDRLGPRDCATVIGHPAGGMKGIPDASRVIVALSKVRPGPRNNAAQEITRLLSKQARVSRIVTIAEGSAAAVGEAQRVT